MAYNNITIEQFLQVQEYLKIDNPIRQKALVLSVLKSIPIEQIDSMIVADMLKEYNKAAKDFEGDLPTDWRGNIEIEGQTFKPKHSFKHWSTWQLTSLMSLTKDGDTTNMAHVLAVMCLKDNEKSLSVEDFEARVELFRKVTMDKAYPLYVFFCVVWVRFLQVTQSYSKAVAEAQVGLVKGGGFTAWFTKWRKMIIQKWKRYWRATA